MCIHIFGCKFEYTGIFTCLSVDLNTVEVDFVKKIAKNWGKKNKIYFNSIFSKIGWKNKGVGF